MTLNVENILVLREAILAHPDNFGMAEWGGGLTPQQLFDRYHGATACLGGWAEALFCVPADQKLDKRRIAVAEALGLLLVDANDLFFPCLHGSARKIHEDFNPYDATAAQAAIVLDHLIETGDVDWNKAYVA
jgi:hypothetical protein